jgi:hypothetical protein
MGGKRMAGNIVFNMINVNSLNRNAGVSIGENTQSSWDAHGKNNNGNGMLLGNFINLNNLIIINDNDIFDVPINDNDFKPATSAQV